MEFSIISWRCSAKNPSKFLSEFHPWIFHSTISGFRKYGIVGHRIRTRCFGYKHLPIPFSQLPNCCGPCQRICCSHREGDVWNLYIGNPATKTWRQLPRPPHVGQYWNFNAMTFDATSRHCTLVLGENNVEMYRERSGNPMVLEIYDSESNAWTTVSMNVPCFIQPHGKGLYSKGKFYWVIIWNAMHFMVALSIAEICWI